MNADPNIRQLVQRLMGHNLATSRSSAKIALGALTAFSDLLGRLTPVLGESGATELFRRSLDLSENSFPSIKKLRTADRSGLLAALGVFLQNQQPDVALDASVAVLTTYIELLTIFIGHPVTWQLLEEEWPSRSTTLSTKGDQE